jgi:hypothetical protein
MGIKTIDLLTAECGVNDVLETLNKTIESYNGIMDPIVEAEEICLKASKLTDTGATAKHVILGLFISAAADKNCTYEDMKKEITIS